MAYQQNREFTKTQFTRIKPHMQGFFPLEGGGNLDVSKGYIRKYIYVCTI